MTLDEFVADWLDRSPMRPPAKPYEKVAENVGVTLYRDNEFQVQLWTCAPNTEISDHTHPDVDGMAVRVAGDIRFRKHGKPVNHRDMKIMTWRGMRTPAVHLGPNDSHGVSIGPVGGSFLAITRWLNGGPQSVHLNWQGDPLDETHAKELERVV